MEDESGFARIWAIIKHHGNDEQDYVFIYVVWFEDVLRQDELFSCLIYRLQKDTNDSCIKFIRYLQWNLYQNLEGSLCTIVTPDAL